MTNVAEKAVARLIEEEGWDRPGAEEAVGREMKRRPYHNADELFDAINSQAESAEDYDR